MLASTTSSDCFFLTSLRFFFLRHVEFAFEQKDIEREQTQFMTDAVEDRQKQHHRHRQTRQDTLYDRGSSNLWAPHSDCGDRFSNHNFRNVQREDIFIEVVFEGLKESSRTKVMVAALRQLSSGSATTKPWFGLCQVVGPATMMGGRRVKLAA